MKIIIAECYAELSIAEKLIENIKEIKIKLKHAKGIDRLINTWKKVKGDYQKIVLLFDTEEGKPQFKYVKGVLKSPDIDIKVPEQRV